MMSKNVFGFFICLAIFLSGFFWHGHAALYFNVAGLFVVIGGTACAVLLTYRLDRLKIVYKVLVASYRHRHKQPEDIVEILVDLSVKSRFKGLLSLQRDERESSSLFMRRALGMLVDGYKGERIRDILNTEMYFFKLRRDDCEQVLRTVAELLPSFGLVGSVVGLISMLGGVSKPELILQTVPIALTSTLYGVVLANFFFVPFAGNLRDRTDQELLVQKIIMDGVLAIEGDMNPRSLEKKLKSFVTPSARKGRLVSWQRIQDRFHLKNASGLPSL